MQRKMDLIEVFKRIRRGFDGNISNRKVIFILLAILFILIYMMPTLYRLLIAKPSGFLSTDLFGQSFSYRLAQYKREIEEQDSYVKYFPPQNDRPNYLPYIGNGYIGMSVEPESPIFIRNNRALSLPINFRPLTLLSCEGLTMEEAIIIQYKNGIVTHLQNWQTSDAGGSIDITYQTYAHRSSPSLIMQDIKINNPTLRDLVIETEQLGLSEWQSASTQVIKIQHGSGQHDYLVISGMIDVPGSINGVIAATVVTLKIPQSLEVVARHSISLHVVTSVNYSEPISIDKYNFYKDATEAAAILALKLAVTGNIKKLQNDHIQIWQNLWLSGFSISHSKADNALNGDLINATIYAVLSQTRAPLHELFTSAIGRDSILRDLAYAEGCYGGHHTLQADRLWSKLDTVDDINTVVSVWMMTLEKQGCHQLIRAGADGVMLALLLSFGGLQFKNQHLEFNTDPSHLHRDHHFRRISYGNGTHLNISVVVQEEDYKAVMYVALDQSDKNYYGCDAGCLDSPVQLGPRPIMFPVKLTQPLTAILYITSDRVHMEELKHTIHVKEIALAPAHEHHVIALHKHGHKWGGLPTLFWMTIIALIVIFHLFLFKLVINEYCGTDLKVRYRKLSDFQ